MSIKNMLKHWRTRILGQDTTVLREIYWGQIYHDTIRNSDWFLNPSLSPGRWAVGYNYLYVLYRILDDVEPQFILEMGLGQSTKMIGQYAMHHESPGKIKHVVIEHDEVWEDFFFKKNRDLYKNTQLITLPLIDVKKEGESFKAYQNFQATIEKLNIKFIYYLSMVLLVQVILGGEGIFCLVCRNVWMQTLRFFLMILDGENLLQIRFKRLRKYLMPTGLGMRKVYTQVMGTKAFVF